MLTQEEYVWGTRVEEAGLVDFGYARHVGRDRNSASSPVGRTGAGASLASR